MSNPISPEVMWQARFDELELDFQWSQLLLAEELDPQQPGLSGSINQTLSEVQAAFNNLKLVQANLSAADQWAQLAAVRQQSRRTFADILVLLGGLAIRSGLTPGEAGLDSGISVRAEKWLRQLLPPLGLKTVPTVLPARGPLVNLDPESDPGLVRAPFLDWDLWHLPLLGRAVGLIAAAEDPKNRLRSAMPQLQDLIPAAAAQPEHFWRYLQLLFAELFTTAVLGPVYALPVFVLDLDYARPAANGLEDPDLLSGRAAAPRLAPSPVERAAVILDTLAYVDNLTGGKMADAGTRLEALWTGITAPFQQDQLLAQTRAARQAGHQRLLSQVLSPLLSIHWAEGAAENPASAWQNALDWYAFLSSPNKPQPQLPPAVDEQDFLTALLGGLWWHRLYHPGRAKQAAENAQKILDGRPDVTPYGVIENLPAAQLAAGARQGALEAQARRLERVLLSSTVLQPEDRELVSGRLFQMLSRQVYQLDQIHSSPPGQPPGLEFWQQVADAQQASLPLKREALEFLGGLLVRYRSLSSRLHPPGVSPPPSICSLAEHQLERLVMRTGVNWKTLIVPGPDAFVATDTKIIRVRFPDWSVWNLPLMAHEFGHVVAGVNNEFRRYQWETALQAAAGVSEKQWSLQSQLEELFCDIFATFVFGPAFACNALLLQFNPPEAAAVSPSHPTYDERAVAILAAMEAINARTPQPSYQQAIDLLRKAWQGAVQQSLPVLPNQAEHERRLNWAEDRARELFAIIDRQFRLGASFSPEAWQTAQKLADQMAKKIPPPDYEELSGLAQQQGGVGLSLPVLLNALWWARARYTRSEVERLKFARLANQYGLGYLSQQNGGAG